MADRIRRYSYPRETVEIPHYYHSFSSTLLDSIYREIDRVEEPEIAVCRNNKAFTDDRKLTAPPAVDVKRLRKLGRANLSSASVDYGSGGGFFSTSEGESLPIRRPKAVRTGGLERGVGDGAAEQKAANSNLQEGGFVKTKSRALKIYGELKKVKQPISPGGKLAGLWNSLISSAGSLKKPKLGGAGDDSPSLKSTTTNTSSTCSSTSSFSRSCLSKGKSSSCTSSGEKRSVRFFPVSVIVDEDCQPCGHKALRQENTIKSAIDEDLMIHIMKYQKKAEISSPFHDQSMKNEELEDEIDGWSESSSDLFELDNLSAIGMDGNRCRYGEELPVYETTDIRTNRAIAAKTFHFRN